MNKPLKMIAGLSALLMAAQVYAEITFYEGENFHGRAFSTEKQIPNLNKAGYNNQASSVIVDEGRWVVCEDKHFKGHCVILRRGSYGTLRGMGLNNQVSSVRRAEEHERIAVEAPDPIEVPDYEYRRRPHEHVFEAPVITVHAIGGSAERRCWMEREEVEEHHEANVGGAVAGAIIGGIIGHQIGGGNGNKVATVGGAVIGAAIGANAGGGDGEHEREVRRCEQSERGHPEFWEVVYRFKGIDHRLQMSTPPGRTITVNEQGEPRQ